MLSFSKIQSVISNYFSLVYGNQKPMSIFVGDIAEETEIRKTILVSNGKKFFVTEDGKKHFLKNKAEFLKGLTAHEKVDVWIIRGSGEVCYAYKTDPLDKEFTIYSTEAALEKAVQRNYRDAWRRETINASGEKTEQYFQKVSGWFSSSVKEISKKKYQLYLSQQEQAAQSRKLNASVLVGANAVGTLLGPAVKVGVENASYEWNFSTTLQSVMDFGIHSAARVAAFGVMIEKSTRFPEVGAQVISDPLLPTMSAPLVFLGDFRVDNLSSSILRQMTTISSDYFLWTWVDSNSNLYGRLYSATDLSASRDVLLTSLTIQSAPQMPVICPYSDGSGFTFGFGSGNTWYASASSLNFSFSTLQTFSGATSYPSIASRLTCLLNGNIVLSGLRVVGSNLALYSSVYNPNLTTQNAEFLIVTAALFSGVWDIIGLTDNGFAMAWINSDPAAIDVYGIPGKAVYGTTFSSAGVVQVATFKINSNLYYSTIFIPPSTQYINSLDYLKLGSLNNGFVSTWTVTQYYQAGPVVPQGTFGRSFSNGGVAQGSQAQISSANLVTSALSPLSNGNFILIHSTGNILCSNTAFPVATLTIPGSSIVGGAVASNMFLLLGLSTGGSFPYDYDIIGQIYSSSGVALQSPFIANTYVAGFQQSPMFIAIPTRGFLVSWVGDSTGQGAFLKFYPTMDQLMPTAYGQDFSASYGLNYFAFNSIGFDKMDILPQNPYGINSLSASVSLKVSTTSAGSFSAPMSGSVIPVLSAGMLSVSGSVIDLDIILNQLIFYPNTTFFKSEY